MGAGNGHEYIKMDLSLYIRYPEIELGVNFNKMSRKNFSVKRKIGENAFELYSEQQKRLQELYVPFVTNGIKSSVELLSDTLGKINFVR